MRSEGDVGTPIIARQVSTAVLTWVDGHVVPTTLDMGRILVAKLITTDIAWDVSILSRLIGANHPTIPTTSSVVQFLSIKTPSTVA